MKQDSDQTSSSEVVSLALPSTATRGFTAGPWRLHETSKGATEIIGRGVTLASITRNANTEKCAGANARLMVASPDMLAALHEVEDFLDNQSDVEDGDYGVPRPNRAMRLLIEVRDAISKATGVTA